MSLFKLDPSQLKATKTSEFDQDIEALLAAYDEDGSNVFAFKKEDESKMQGMVSRMKSDYQSLLDARNLKIRQLTIGFKQAQLKDQGYTKMICLVTEDTQEDGNSSNPPVQE